MPESPKPRTNILQRFVQAVVYVRAAAALWWIGGQFATDEKTATSPFERMLAAVLGVMERILSEFGD